MATDLNSIDPQWAWSPYQPEAGRPWNRAMAAHLFRRAGLGANSQQLDDAAQREPQEVVEQLVNGGETVPFRQVVEGLSQSVVNAGQVDNLAAVWLYRMLATPDPLLEKMTLFWHGHFATSADKVQDAKMMHNQIELLRRHARGDFGRLVQEVSRNPAMLIYLDSTTNRKSHPNENFAREVMELFCLGEGSYTEKDIQELARCFTGWEVKRKKFRFNRYQHDSGVKSILGSTGAFSGEDGVRLVLEQPATARFIVGKLIRFFIFDEPQPSPELVEPLAREFRDHDLHIQPVLQRIFGSQLFFSPYAVGRHIRSPVELAVGLLRALKATTNNVQLAEELAQLGQGLFFPPNVKGWDGGRTWINSSTLLGRANLVLALLESEKTRFDGGDLETLIDRYGIESSEQLVNWLREQLVAVPLTAHTHQRLIELAETQNGNRSRQIAAVIYTMSTLPEFQLG